MPSINPSATQFERLLAEVPDGRPVVMLNLLRFREQADYPADFDAAPCSGVEAYARYGAVAAERVASVGGRIVWTGRAELTVIGPEQEAWDMAVLVEYPSKQAFTEMFGQAKYQAAAPHRGAALADSRLIATETLAEAFAG